MRTKAQTVAYKNRVAFFKKYKLYVHPGGPALRCFPKPTGFFKTSRSLGYKKPKKKANYRTRIITESLMKIRAYQPHGF